MVNIFARLQKTRSEQEKSERKEQERANREQVLIADSFVGLFWTARVIGALQKRCGVALHGRLPSKQSPRRKLSLPEVQLAELCVESAPNGRNGQALVGVSVKSSAALAIEVVH